MRCSENYVSISEEYAYVFLQLLTNVVIVISFDLCVDHWKKLYFDSTRHSSEYNVIHPVAVAAALLDCCLCFAVAVRWIGTAAANVQN